MIFNKKASLFRPTKTRRNLDAKGNWTKWMSFSWYSWDSQPVCLSMSLLIDSALASAQYVESASLGPFFYFELSNILPLPSQELVQRTSPKECTLCNNKNNLGLHWAVYSTTFSSVCTITWTTCKLLANKRKMTQERVLEGIKTLVHTMGHTLVDTLVQV